MKEVLILAIELGEQPGVYFLVMQSEFEGGSVHLDNDKLYLAVHHNLFDSRSVLEQVVSFHNLI